ncbi:glycosyltransferase [Cuniculiplasma sp. SKW3]|uniref:glycosyltransferase n=1 Tax=unclassified Cuniculiplasma TaxID=2619706 RepID=UPI003FD180AF
MGIVQIILFYFFIVLFSIIFIVQLILAWPRKYKRSYSGSYKGKVLVIIPIRGVDFELSENLESIKFQDYKNYSIICVVDDEKDQCVEHIIKAKLDYIVSTFQSSGSGKVRAISTAIERYRDFDAYVVADSDIRVKKDWLTNLLRPLSVGKFGVSTTFPYFKSAGEFWSKFKTVWGFVGKGMMESPITVFAWGGSMAFRRDLLDGRMDEFSSDISDDMAVTRISKGKGLEIAYVPEATPYIYSPDNWDTFKEWSIRQTSLLVSRNRSALKIGILLYGSMCLLILGSIILSILSSYIFLIWFLPVIMSEIKLGTRLKDKGFAYYIAGLIMPFFYTWNLYIASKTGKIMWRGKEYKL